MSLIAKLVRRAWPSAAPPHIIFSAAGVSSDFPVSPTIADYLPAPPSVPIREKSDPEPKSFSSPVVLRLQELLLPLHPSFVLHHLDRLSGESNDDCDGEEVMRMDSVKKKRKKKMNKHKLQKLRKTLRRKT